MTDKTLKDETLTYYYYDDGLSKAERREVEQALERDPELARRYSLLTRDLDSMRRVPDVAAPEGLEHRLTTALDRAARLEAAPESDKSVSHSFFSFRPRFLALGGATAAALAVGIGIGVWLSEGPSTVPPLLVQPPATASAEWSPAAFQRGIASYFRTGRSDLAGIGSVENGNRAALISALIQQNRLYTQLALQNEAPDIARVLRSFEPVLRQLGREDLTPEESADLKAKLEFEFAVMLTKLERSTSQQTENTKQDLSL